MSDPPLVDAEEIPEELRDHGDHREYRGEFELDLVRWFRRRFAWMCGVYAVLQTFIFASLLALALSGLPAETDAPTASVSVGDGVTLALGELATSPDEVPAASDSPSDWRIGTLVDAITAALGLVAIAIFALKIRPRIDNRIGALSAATRLLLLLGALIVAGEFVKRIVAPEMVVSPLASVMLLHFSACLFLPWTPRESVRPILPLLVAWAGYRLIVGIVALLASSARFEPLVVTVVEVVASPMILLPGMGLCWWRLRRYRRRFGREFTGRKLRALRREIKQARTIHDSLFPATFEAADPIRFDYAYAPASDLGGDFLHIHRHVDGAVTMVLLDVTGHGLSAAMTVNRLVGEIERLHAERPDTGPGELLAGLNRYVHLTLARHSLLATAAAVLVDPARGAVRIANAGHPPVLRRRRNGVLDHFGATEPLLGALPSEEFGTLEHEFELAPGETLFAYTDGAFEARDRTGRELGLDGFARLCGGQPAPSRWPSHLLRIVEGFEGPIRGDDVLVATLAWTGVGVDRPNPAPPRGGTRTFEEETIA
jgi:hypothetical protein